VENNHLSEPETWSRRQSAVWTNNKMEETFQKQCKGHSMGATMFLVHAVILLTTRSMCDAWNDRNV